MNNDRRFRTDETAVPVVGFSYRVVLHDDQFGVCDEGVCRIDARHFNDDGTVTVYSGDRPGAFNLWGDDWHRDFHRVNVNVLTARL